MAQEKNNLENKDDIIINYDNHISPSPGGEEDLICPSSPKDNILNKPMTSSKNKKI
jgi:hypothetical protein